jgi:hypothetical protein
MYKKDDLQNSSHKKAKKDPAVSHSIHAVVRDFLIL